MEPIRELSVLLKSTRIGFMRAPYASCGFESGERSSRRSNSSCIQCESCQEIEELTRTSATSSIDSAHLPNSSPAAIGSMVSARSNTRLPWPSRHLRHHAPRMSAYPLCASLSVDNIAGEAGCDGCVGGNGNVRRNATKGTRVSSSDGGKGLMGRSEPGGGMEPDEPSATSLV